MRVLCVTLLYPPHHLGGYERACQDVMERLALRGHDVTVLTSRERQPGVADPSAEGDTNPRVCRELESYHRRGTLLRPSLSDRLRIERANQAALTRVLTECEPDVVSPWHMGALSAGLLAALARSHRPLVYGICDDWPTYVDVVDPWSAMFRRHRWLGGVVERVLDVPTAAPPLGPTGAFCFLSESTRRRCQDHGGDGPWPRTAVVYTGIDLTRFTPRVASPEFRQRILYAGRPDPRKGVATLARAMAYLPEAALTYYFPPGHLGTTDEAADRSTAELQALVNDLGVADQVAFAEGSGTEAIVARYHAADVVAFPSQWPEPLGLVPIEAMACGVPVIGTGVGGSGEYLVHGANALLFPPGDATALAASVQRLAGDPALRAHLTGGGLATARQFDADISAVEYEAWFRAALDGFRSGSPRQRRLSLPAPAPEVPLAVSPPAAAPLAPLPPGTIADVRVGIVSWNTAALLDDCLAALPAALGRLRAEVVVVDNNSSDDSASIAESHLGLRVVRNDENLGYARAMNQALAGTEAPVLIALNPDTVAPPGSLATLVRRLEDQPDVGLVAPRLMSPDGRSQHSVYRWPSPLVGLVVALVPPRWQPGLVGRRFWLEGSSPHDRSTDIDWVIGAVHVIRRAALGGEPPFDERWWMYVEDIELCWRLSRRGWRRRLEGDVQVVHIGGASARQMWDDPAPIYFAATYDWYARDRGRAAARRWAIANVIGVTWRVASLLVVGALTRSRDRVQRARALGPMLRVHLGVLLSGPPSPLGAPPVQGRPTQ